MSDLAEEDIMYTEEEYYALDLPIKTELIYWRVYYLAAPSIGHQDIQVSLSAEILSYIRRRKGKCKVLGAPCDVKLADGIIVQPDIFVTCDRDKLGKQYHNGAPDWVIEIVSPGGEAHDYRDKFRLYKDSGVKEYWIADAEKQYVMVYLFGETDIVKTYSFEDTITVELYKDEDEPLKLSILEVRDQK